MKTHFSSVWKRMRKVHKNAWKKSKYSIKSILRALLQFGSRSITMTHFLQELLSCNKLCAIIVVGRHHKLSSIYRSYLDFRPCCNMLFIETLRCLLNLFQYINKHVKVWILYKTILITLDGPSHAVSVAYLWQVMHRACTVSFATVSE